MDVSVAVTQFASNTDKENNRQLAANAVRSAARAGADLVVLPESSMYIDLTHGPVDYAEKLDGPFVNTVATVARESGTTVVAGMTEIVDGADLPSNTLVVVGADGDLICVYRKIHLYDAFGFRESDLVAAGEISFAASVFDIQGLRFGLMTCYDLRFPETARHLVDAGATVLLAPAAWVSGPAKELHWNVLARARAIENTCYVAVSGQTGPVFCGQSMILDPLGTVLAGVDEAPGQAVARLSARRVEQVRSVNPSLANRRFRVLPRTMCPR